MTDTLDHLEAGQSSLSRRIIMIWLMGTLVLLPVEFVKLPFNMALVDLWILMALPFFWLYFIFAHQRMNITYTVAMWFILVGGLASTFAAPDPSGSLVVLIKEIYLFVWFITLTALLSRLSAGDFRLILLVWIGTVILHGTLIIVEFLFPDIWRITLEFATRLGEMEPHRPTGFFINANKSAFYQLLGFVPLLLAIRSKKIATILGIWLFLSILGTGSMAATAALLIGLITAIVAVLVLSKRLVPITKNVMQLVIVISLLGGLFYFVISQYQDLQVRFDKYFLGRAERSSEGRFDLWQGGIDVLLDGDVALWGIGPENFRVVDVVGKQLHNDLLAFVVERGLLGTLGLVLFGIIAVSRATYVLLLYSKYSDRPRLEVVVFLAAIAAILVESQTHQIFHARSLWFVLALQEAMILRMKTYESRLEPATHLPNGTPQHRHALGVQRDVTGGWHNAD